MPARPKPENAGDGAAGGTKDGNGIASIAELDARFAAAFCCPHCQSTVVGRWGFANGLKRYRCKACAVTFNALTGTPLAQLHTCDLWFGHEPPLTASLCARWRPV